MIKNRAEIRAGQQAGVQHRCWLHLPLHPLAIISREEEMSDVCSSSMLHTVKFKCVICLWLIQKRLCLLFSHDDVFNTEL